MAAGAADRCAAAAVLPAHPRRAQRHAALALRLRQERRPGEDRDGTPGYDITTSNKCMFVSASGEPRAVFSVAVFVSVQVRGGCGRR